MTYPPMIYSSLPSFGSMGLNAGAMFPMQFYPEDNVDYYFACEQLWAVREGLA